MTPIQVTVDGITMWVREERANEDIEIINEVITTDCYKLRWMKAQGFEPKTIMSVGSHIGTFETLAHSLWPEAVIVSVEPTPDSFELLMCNVAWPGLQYNAAIAYEEDVILTDGRGSTGGGFTATRERYESAAREKQGQDSWLYSIIDTPRCMTFEEISGGPIDLLKMDCEGAEIGILKHMTEVAGTRIRYIVGEYHHRRGFPYFKALAEDAMPHLKIYGGNGRAIGPFFSFPYPDLERHYASQSWNIQAAELNLI